MIIHLQGPINMKYAVLLYTKISIINTEIQKRGILQFSQQNVTFSVVSFRGENVLLFSAPMSQAIFNLNYLHHSAVFVDNIFAHPWLIYCECLLICNVELNKYLNISRDPTLKCKVRQGAQFMT